MIIRSAQDIIKFIESDDWMMSLLAAVKSLGASDCWLAAGAIRNPIWAKLHGAEFKPETENDVDVIYFDKSDISRGSEEIYEARLKMLVPRVKWEVRNQARMHIRNGDAPYKDCFNALEHWAETPTAIGARIDHQGIELLAPYGVDDLLNLTVRQTPKFRYKREIYERRIKEKGWRQTWPLLDII